MIWLSTIQQRASTVWRRHWTRRVARRTTPVAVTTRRQTRIAGRMRRTIHVRKWQLVRILTMGSVHQMDMRTSIHRSQCRRRTTLYRVIRDIDRVHVRRSGTREAVRALHTRQHISAWRRHIRQQVRSFDFHSDITAHQNTLWD